MTGTRTRPRLSMPAATVLVVLGALTACSAQPGAEIPGPTSSSPRPTPIPAPSPTFTPTPTPTGSSPAAPGSGELPEDLPLPSATGTPVRVTGTVTEGVEQGCLVLTDGGTTYLLLGAHDQLPPGASVVVDGTLAVDVVTTCQQGTPLLVQAVRPL